MPIIWRDEMSVGNDVIDQDHRYLICLFNSIELALASERKAELLPLFFEQLFDYTRFHFEREERIQFKSKYTGYFEHKQAHQRIIEDLARVNEELKNGVDSFHQDLLVLAREWVVNHLLNSDQKMKSHLKKLPSTYQ